LIGRAVPVVFPPTNTNPLTLNSTRPVLRSTRADPVRVVHGSVPLWIWLTTLLCVSVMTATGLSTPGAVITPTMSVQLTTES
jgi:hypothetical protein